jgi:hypothetical protein
MLIVFFCSVAATSAASVLPQESRLTQIWNAQSLALLQKGEMSIPDTFINEFLAQQLTADSGIKAVKLTAKDENLVSIQMTTTEGKEYFLEGTFQEFRHDKDRSYFKFKITKKSRAGKSLTSWLFSHLSLGFITNIFGGVDFPAGTTVKINGNTVTVDFHDALRPKPGTPYSNPIFDIVRIHEVTSTAGAMHVRTSVDMNYALHAFGNQLFNTK